MYLVKHTSFETFFQVREIRPGPASHIGVIDVCDILRDRWHGGPWWPWLVTSASCPKAGWMSKGEPTSYHNRSVDKTQLLLQLQFWVQHGWTNQLWVPISHYNGLIFFPFKQTTCSHLVLWGNPWLSHEQSSIHGGKSQLATVTCTFWWDENYGLWQV